MKLRLEIEDLKKDYEELKAINEELRRKIDILLNK
jgi:cell division protein FtsB